jgi:hypothetical protein
VTVEEVIEHFGSIRKTAEAVGVEFQAVSNWKQKGFVPEGRQWQIQALSVGQLRVDEKYLKKPGAAA